MENEIMNNEELNTELAETETTVDKKDNTVKNLLIGAGTGVGIGYAVTRLLRHVPGIKKLFIKQDQFYLANQGYIICDKEGNIVLMKAPKEEPKTEETTEETK